MRSDAAQLGCEILEHFDGLEADAEVIGSEREIVGMNLLSWALEDDGASEHVDLPKLTGRSSKG